MASGRSNSIAEQPKPYPRRAGGYPGAFSVLPSEDGDRTDSPDREVYLQAAERLLPAWIKQLAEASWNEGCPASSQERNQAAARQFGEASAMLAVGLLAEIDPDRSDRDYLRHIVHDALVRWALNLRSDGRPKSTRVARDGLSAATAGQVVLLLSETAGYGHELILKEVERHLDWQSRRPVQSPWVEASWAAALADAGVLLRRRDFLERSRRRLSSLLDRQDEEGWFPEFGGADIGRLSLTIDALARAYRHNDWSELREPIQRALTFLTPFVHPDGGIGGCFSSAGTAFLSPAGVELLADEFPDAAYLAADARRVFVSTNDLAYLTADGLLGSTLGAAGLLAIDHHRRPTVDASLPPHALFGRFHYPRAGWTVISTAAYYAVLDEKRGGLLRVSWRDGAPPFADSGATILIDGGTLGAIPEHLHGAWRSDHRFECTGRLRPASHHAAGGAPPTGGLRRLLDRLKNSWRAGFREDSRCTPLPDERIPLNGFRREISFEPHTIRLWDEVRLAFPVEALLFSGEARWVAPPFMDRLGGMVPSHAPFVVEGGRRIRVVRVYREGRLVDSRTEREGVM